MALSAARNTPERDHPFRSRVEYGMNASATIYQGGIVVLDDADGYAIAGVVAVGNICLGRAAETKTNSGADGATTIKVDQGCFRFDNASAGDAIALDDVGKDCYILSDHQVGLTDGSSARSRAGKIVDVDSAGVWVLMGVGV